ncbi:MAG: AIR carboxylase family protein [Micavibrio sp.]|nr:AIR carboxylase family protein [Micavibrio sp.]
MKVFVVFGSKSDDNVQGPLADALKKDFDVTSEVISAHRDLEKLQSRMAEWQGHAYIAGAGLAAALPGVVAAMTNLPVFGVPVPNQFGGLDSLGSIAQMPPGVPVITAGPASTAPIVQFLKQYKESKVNFAKINFVARSEALLKHPELLADVEKARLAAADKGGEVTLSGSESPDAFNVRMVADESHIRADAFCLHVPFVEKANVQKPETYLTLLAWANKGGLWVGANNTRNAVHSALRLNGAAKIAKERAA